MRLTSYLKEQDLPYFSMMTALMNEDIIPDNLFTSLKKVGDKIGFRIDRSSSIFDYISKAESGLADLFTYATLYFMSSDPKQKEQLKQDMERILKSVNIREVTAFLMQLDRATFGITSHVRHVLMSLFGIEVTTYNKFVSNVEFIHDEIKKIRTILGNMGTQHNVIKALDKFEYAIKGLKEDGEGSAEGGIVTGDVATMPTRITGMARRNDRKKKRKTLLGYIKEDTDVIIKSPKQCDVDDLTEFIDMLEEQGQVAVPSIAKLKTQKYLAFLYDEGSVIGIGAIKTPGAEYKEAVFGKAGADPDAYDDEIGYFYIDEQYRGSGIFKTLVTELLSKASKNVFLTTRERNTPVINTFKGFGFERVGNPYNNGGRENLIIMGRRN